MSSMWVQALVFGLLLAAPGFSDSLTPEAIVIDLASLGIATKSEQPLREAIEKQDWRGVEELLFAISQRDPPNAALLQALGAAHLNNQRYLQAASAYVRADRIAPLDEASRFALANAYLGLEKSHWARRELERLARENPRNALYPFWLASVFHEYQWFELAYKQAQRAVVLLPESAKAHERLGQVLEALNRKDEAREAYRQAVAKARRANEPAPSEAYHLGRLLRELGEFEESAEWLAAALELAPKFWEAHYELGRTLYRLDRWDGALAALTEAVEVQPNEARIHYALAQTYKRRGDTEAARSSLSRFQALSK